MHRPVTGLAAAALAVLAATGCMSVAPADGKPPVARHRPDGPAPVPVFTAAKVAQPPAVDKLVTIRPSRSPAAPSPPRPQRSVPAGTSRAQAEPQPTAPPKAAPRGPARRERSAPVRRPAPRPVHRAPHTPERAPGSAGYGMGDVCRAAQTVTDPSVAALCREVYGH